MYDDYYWLGNDSSEYTTYRYTEYIKKLNQQHKAITEKEYIESRFLEETYDDMKEETPMKVGQLYKAINEDKAYGKYLATDSTGKVILEMLNGGVNVYDKSELEEVIPYTISIKFKTNDKVYSYQSDKGVLNEGDLVVYEGPFDRTIAQVVAVDTKDKAATKKFVGWKLNTTRID